MSKETFRFQCDECSVEVAIDVEPSYDLNTMRRQGFKEGVKLFEKLDKENHGHSFACVAGCGGKMVEA